MKLLQPHLKIRILGAGRSWPDVAPMSNLDLLKRHPDTHDKPAKFLEEMADRIERGFGPHQRYMTHFPGTPFTDDEETSESLALKSCGLAVAGDKSRKPSAIVLGSTTSPRYTGSAAAAVAGKLGLSIPAFEVKSGCSTSLFSLQLTYGLLMQGYDDVLLSCAETLSKVINPQVRETWFGFGDASAALWIARDESSPQFEILKVTSSTDGELVDLYTTPGKLPPSESVLESGGYFMSGDSSEMKDRALERYLKTLDAILPDRAERKKINWIIGHQVNRGLTDLVIQTAGLSGELPWPGKDFGNMGGTSVLFTLTQAIEKGSFKKGDLILLMSVGGGMSYAAQLWRAL